MFKFILVYLIYICEYYFFELFKYTFANYIAKLYINWQNIQRRIYIYTYTIMGKIINIHTQIYMNCVFNKYMGISLIQFSM